jgi:3-methyladenine DNA glycosylase AlkD
MPNLPDILTRLHQLADPAVVDRKARKFGITSSGSLGVFMKDLNALAKELPKDPDLAVALFNTGIYEARLLCSKIFPSGKLTEELAQHWVTTFDNWEITDSFSTTVFARSFLAKALIKKWKDRQPEFERRAAFATMAAYCMADKKAENDVFQTFLPWIEQAATDERTYVKKAVHWALRNIGKRNVDLHREALACARSLTEHPDATA